MVIVGAPGAGKSTFVRKWLHDCAAGSALIAPCLVNVRELQFGGEQPGLVSWVHAQAIQQLQVELSVLEMQDILALGCATVVFDGVDEVVDVTRRRTLVSAIEAFCVRFPFVHVLVTSRLVGLEEARPSNRLFYEYELPEFRDVEVGEYVHKWFALQGTDSERDAFMRESVHAADLLRNPLLLSLLCSLYQYNGYIPENRPEVYEQCSELLFQRWDKVRHIPAPLRLVPRSKQLLEELANYMLQRQDVQSGLEESRLRQFLTRQLLDSHLDDWHEATYQAAEFLEYCAGRAWLLTQVGVSVKGQRLFGFTHRTFMEYFAGRRLARLATSPQDLAEKVAALLDAAVSEVVPQIALQSYDSMSDHGSDAALRFLLFDSVSLTGRPNLKYLPFAIDCLEFLVPRPRTTRSLLSTALASYPEHAESERIASGLRRVSPDVLTILVSLAQSPALSAEQLVALVRLECRGVSSVQWAELFSAVHERLRVTSPDSWRSREWLAIAWLRRGLLDQSEAVTQFGTELLSQAHLH